jgi:hypothetical protein
MLLALLMIGAAAFAQNSGDVFVGYSYNHASTGWSDTGNLNGWEASVQGKIAPYAGVVVDMSTQYGTLQLPAFRLFGAGATGTDDSTTRVVSYLFGGRLSLSKGKLQPFVQGLVGAAHLHEAANEFSYGETSFADSVDAGLDYHLRGRLAWRLQGGLLQTRFHGGTQDDARISTGLVMHF